MKNISIIFLLFSLIVHDTHARIHWPEGKKAAVILTYDDGLKSQLQIVIPQLEKHNFRGTFFLYGQVIKEEDIPWMAENCMKVSAAGVMNNPVVFLKEEIAEIYRKAL